ncbi:MAG TPA: hypothetical protein PKI94_06955 [Candidatus Gastranaerophilaceae bacterium]|nr:hypothetical protein [Candidatus Gastranaerophilaceae bacterium]
MPNMYDDFEKRFENAPFFAGWVEFEVKPAKAAPIVKAEHKDIDALSAELKLIEEQLEEISLKELRLANLAQFYQ